MMSLTAECWGGCGWRRDPAMSASHAASLPWTALQSCCYHREGGWVGEHDYCEKGKVPPGNCSWHLALDNIRSSKLCLHFYKDLSWLREKSWCIPHCFKRIISSFRPCTYFIIKLSADEMRHHSDCKCIFKTSLLTIISQWLDKENLWITICF